jgi:predicted NAD-dependent protein-ADP-ribosyltransferase YbiA (DUF1768 family)
MSIDIWYGRDQHPLSNLADRSFADKDGVFYYCVEHAYQSWKSGSFDVDTYNKYTTYGIKIVSRLKAKTEGNWNIELMKKVIRFSFEQNEEALQYLLDTGDEYLTHYNDKGIWNTAFPKILMDLRAEFKSKKFKQRCFAV